MVMLEKIRGLVEEAQAKGLTYHNEFKDGWLKHFLYDPDYMDKESGYVIVGGDLRFVYEHLKEGIEHLSGVEKIKLNDNECMVDGVIFVKQ